MPIAPLILFAALVAAGADSAALVEKLGSADPAERASAAELLKSLGRPALAPLEKALKSGDAGFRERAEAVWEAIQRDLANRPSMVRLDDPADIQGEDPFGFDKQTGMRVKVDQASRQEVGAVRGAGPLPFWTALDRLGLAGIYYHNPGQGRFPELNLRKEPRWSFTSTSGPFRIALTGLHLHRDRRLTPGPWVKIDRFGQRINVPAEGPGAESATFFGGLHVMVEPRSWFTQEAPARLTEATDDLGQSLVPGESGLATRLVDNAHFAFYGGDGDTEKPTEFRLKVPEKSGRAAHLRGVVPVMFHVRRPEPTLVIPLADAAGKTFRCDDAEFTIRTVNDSPNGTTVSMTFLLNVDKADLADKTDRELISSRIRVLGTHQLELIDAGGTVVAHAIGGGGGGGNTPALYQCTISSNQRKQRATHLRYFSMLRIRSDAAFEFHDVPLP